MSSLRHHALIDVPLGGQRHGIYWLRLYDRPDGTNVAVVSEVPGNPSYSVSNAISRITTYVVTKFGLDPEQLVLFEIWPKGADANEPASVKRVSLSAQSPRWRKFSRRKLEELLGLVLDPLPTHEALYAEVLRMGGGNRQELLQPVFEALEVSALPPPHGLYKCPLYDQFRREELDAEDSDSETHEESIEVGGKFVTSLSVDRVRSCPWHRAEWKAIADESVQIIQSLGRRDPEAYEAVATTKLLPKIEMRWLASLFRDPIDIRGGGYTNGQHRACALRFSGAERAAIMVDEESLGEISADWVYLGDG